MNPELTTFSDQYLATTGPFPKGSLPIGVLPTGAATTGGGSFRGKSAAIAPPTIATDVTAANKTFNIQASYEFDSHGTNSAWDSIMSAEMLFNNIRGYQSIFFRDCCKSATLAP